VINYIDLTLKEYDQYDDKPYSLKEVIQNNKIVVLLGAPGSGKTSILRKYKSEHRGSQYLTVKKMSIR